MRDASAISRTGAVSVRREVLGEPAEHLREHEPGDHRAEALPAGVELVVADVDEGDDGGADHGEQTGGDEAPVDRGHGRLVLVGRPYREHADDRGEHADGPGGEREDQAERRVHADRLEGGDAEDDRGDQRDLVALEEVGRHARAVADVVAHVVGDGGRVAGVVLGDAGFDLADEVGADVGRLGEDAAADPEEQGEQRTAEPEPDEDRGRGVLEEHDDDGGAEEAQAHREHAGDTAGAERDLERGRQRAGAGRRRGADVAPHREAHADEPGEAGQHAAGDERQGAEQTRLGEREARRATVEAAAASTTSVEVTNTTTASGIRITAIVLNWRFRYAIAPSWIARAISIIVGVPSSAASTPRMR